VIILDDCSPDNSREIIEQYRNHPKVSQIIFNEKNGRSTFKQWEKGIALAKGKWIWIAESDDWCEPSFLETMMQGLNGHDECVIGYCQSYCIVNDNEIRFQTQHPKLTDYSNGHDFINNYMLNGNSIYNASMAVWRKDKFELISKAFTTYKFCGDWMFWVELASLGDVMISGRVLNYFRKHDKDVSGAAYQSGSGHLELIKLGKDLLKGGLINTDQYTRFMVCRYYEFKDQENRIEGERSKEISSIFLSERSVQAIINKNQAITKVKHYLKKTIHSWSR
jgi:glycosyltransferase involved in cell wall biosynthesis